MGEQIENEAWTLGYEWAMGDIYIGCKATQYAHLQILPEFEEGVEAATNELKKQEMKKLILGDDYYDKAEEP